MGGTAVLNLSPPSPAIDAPLVRPALPRVRLGWRRRLRRAAARLALPEVVAAAVAVVLSMRRHHL